MTRALVLLAATACVSLVLTGTAAARTYYAKVGPGTTITLKNAAGVKVSQIPRGKTPFGSGTPPSSTTSISSGPA